MRIPIYNRFIALNSQLPQYLTYYKQKNITPILDYCMEFDNNHLKTTYNILKFIEKYPSNYFAIKLTSLGLNDYNTKSANKNLEMICDLSFHTNSKILIDAENVKYQDYINNISNDFIETYNNNKKAIIYKTYQMYRNDSFNTLLGDVRKYNNSEIKLGIKMVRGAYYFEDKNTGLLYNNIEETHKNYDIGINFLFKNFDDIQNVIFATHNKESIKLITINSSIYNIPKHKIKYASLTGMNNKISDELNNNDYHVMKYLPFGPFFKTMPYFVRRLYENYDIIKYIKN